MTKINLRKDREAIQKNFRAAMYRRLLLIFFLIVLGCALVMTIVGLIWHG